MMETSIALKLVKDRLGLFSNVRDEIIYKIIEGVMDELINVHGLNLSMENARHLMFVVDMSVWRYQSKDASGAMPRNLQFRFHNLLLSDRGEQP